MARTDYTVVRNHNYNRSELSIHERHNERKNTDYANEDIVPERTCLNVHFKQPDTTYATSFDKLVQDGVISPRGLKPDAHIVCEFVFDVNTAWFDEKGGYDFAKDFFSETYKLAVKEVGDERYILSAVMHADERNKGLSEQLGRDVYHYHLHVVYIPVVDKEIRWSKRCKDETLRGTVKEVIHQVSCSKKWAFQDALDADGRPLLNAKGTPMRIPSYRPLQDRFFEHMRAAGYDELQRGEMGSNAQSLTTLEYKVQQEQKRLEKATTLADKQEAKVEKLSAKLDKGKKVVMTFEQLGNAGRKTFRGKRELEEQEFSQITELAKEAIISRAKLSEQSRELKKANAAYRDLSKRYDQLCQQAEPFLQAVKAAPKLVMDFLNDTIQRAREEHKRAKQTHINRER